MSSLFFHTIITDVLQGIWNDLLGDGQAILGITNGGKPGLLRCQYPAGSRLNNYVLDLDVFLGVTELLFDIFDVDVETTGKRVKVADKACE